ncbi:MAG: hypothetical protein Q7T92_11685 [Lutibacter sp.]|nr:hypothetical protein [Lutibacter sp.]
MKFAIITHAAHKLKEKAIFSYEPYVREMNLWTPQSTKEQIVVPMATFTMLLIFSLIIISYVELRWLIPVFIMTIVFYNDIERGDNINNYVVYSNIAVLSLLSIYGIFRIFYKIL